MPDELVQDPNATALSAGDHVLIFGGRKSAPDPEGLQDVYDFSAANRTWRQLAFRVPYGAGYCWTGKEVFVFSGQVLGPTSVSLWATDGGRFLDPVTGQVRTVPAQGAPPPRAVTACVWTGKEVILLGGGVGGHRYYTDCWALDPVALTWRRLPNFPRHPR